MGFICIIYHVRVNRLFKRILNEYHLVLMRELCLGINRIHEITTIK